MADENNPLDDELLRELGLAPDPQREKEAEQVPPVAPVSPASPAPAKGGGKSAKASTKVKAPAMMPEQDFVEAVGQVSGQLPLQVVAVLGKRSLFLQDVLNFKPGQVVELKKLPQDAIDLVANGKLIARGELVLIEGKMGVQIRQVF